MVLKPSEEAPLDAIIWSSHGSRRHAQGRLQHDPGQRRRGRRSDVVASGIDMMSFTGSTRAGIRVAQAAATTVSASPRSWAASRQHPAAGRRLPDGGHQGINR